MAIIALAGGTSPGLGRAIVTALQKTQNTTLILSRKKQSDVPQPSQCHGAKVRYVDYTSEESMVEALKGVETVVSVIKIPGPECAAYQNWSAERSKGGWH